MPARVLPRWLAHAIAAACYGERELWEDLDLGGRDDLGRLLQKYFPPCLLYTSDAADE